jgi:hypothetical protein
MSTDSDWSKSADGVRPDYRGNNGRGPSADPRAGNGGRPPSHRRPANWGPPSPGVPVGRPAPPNPRAASSRPAPSYPIVAQHELDDPDRRGPLGLMKRRRLEDIPKIKPHEVLVWRVGGRYIMDRRELRVHDDTVVRASSVSVVSVRPDTEVEVSFPIDAQDASEFTVKVTFICSVLDAVVVVRDGQVNAADALIAYLRGYQDLFNLGLEHPIKEVNKLRTKMAIQVKSYMTLRPPKIPGMEITSATVQIETPAVLADIGKLTTEQEIELRKQSHAALLDSNRQTHILEKANRMEAVGRNPEAALGLAYADGGISSPQFASQIHQREESRLQRERMDTMAATAREHELEDRGELRRQELEDRSARWGYEKRLWQREDRRGELDWQRAQIEADRSDDREARRAQINANIELLKMYAANGHLDTHNADIEDLIRRIHGDQGGAQLTAGDAPELTGGQAPEFGEPEPDRDY